MATETRVTIIDLEEEDELYCKYPNQTEPQPCFIALDTRTGKMWADYNAEIGNAVPAEVYYGHVRRYDIPVLRASTANELMREIESLAARVVEGADIIWNGNNHVTQLSNDAQQAEAEIELTCSSYDTDLQTAEAYEWFYECRGNIEDRIRAGESLDSIEVELEAETKAEGVFVYGLRQWLENVKREVDDEDSDN